MAKAYCLVTILEITDAAAFDRYVEGHQPTLRPYGGRFLVKGAAGTVLEGHWPEGRMVVHEFPQLVQFYHWYNSAAYQPWKALRQQSAKVNVVVVEGC
ncbi:DUF1330 domain-containing protein [Motiliproteus sediminis]|uniref:DUF1330 domain-containing protein n=1 Tax=Motiliproteus sediminis TaxID=1468178 RepID=UPI001AEFC8B9|nr:DUF1330 domain-containing protein [Motiliproteus sediminis]